MLHELQKQIEATLNTDPVLMLPGITLVVVDKGDVLQTIRQLEGAAGTIIAILPPVARFEPDSGVGPLSDGQIRAVVHVTETIYTARAQDLPPATALAERVAWLLHSANHADRADDTPLGCASISIITDKESVLTYEIVFKATGAIQTPQGPIGPIRPIGPI